MDWAIVQATRSSLSESRELSADPMGGEPVFDQCFFFALSVTRLVPTARESRIRSPGMTRMCFRNQIGCPWVGLRRHSTSLGGPGELTGVAASPLRCVRWRCQSTSRLCFAFSMCFPYIALVSALCVCPRAALRSRSGLLELTTVSMDPGSLAHAAASENPYLFELSIAFVSPAGRKFLMRFGS